jgi:hypothetical protein
MSIKFYFPENCVISGSPSHRLSEKEAGYVLPLSLKLTQFVGFTSSPVQ